MAARNQQKHLLLRFATKAEIYPEQLINVKVILFGKIPV